MIWVIILVVALILIAVLMSFDVGGREHWPDDQHLEPPFNMKDDD
jgi:hypothetical protein